MLIALRNPKPMASLRLIDAVALDAMPDLVDGRCVTLHHKAATG